MTLEAFKKMNNTCGQMRIIAAFADFRESDKRERVFEIINRLEDMNVDLMKLALEMEKLVKEFSQIITEYKND